MDFDVSRKLGPLPAWAWGVLVAGGVWLWSRRGGSMGGLFGGGGEADAAADTTPASGWSGVQPYAAPVSPPTMSGAPISAPKQTAKKQTAKKQTAKKPAAKKAAAKKQAPRYSGGSNGSNMTARARAHRPAIRSAKPNASGGLGNAPAVIMGTDVDQQLAALQGRISGATRTTDQTVAVGVLSGLGGPNYG